MQEEDNDILIIDEPLEFAYPDMLEPELEGLFSPPRRPPDYRKKTKEDNLPIEMDTDRPATINGASLNNLKRLRPSETVAEIKMRIENDVQKFVTREGEDIFLPRKILKRIDFDRIKKSKSRDFKINLPGGYEVRVRIYKDDRVKFFRYGQRKTKKLQNK